MAAFEQMNLLQKFMDIGLPIKSYTVPNQEAVTDPNKIKEIKDLANKNIAIEIDLSKPKEISKALSQNQMRLANYTNTSIFNNEFFAGKWTVKWSDSHSHTFEVDANGKFCVYGTNYKLEYNKYTKVEFRWTDGTI